MKRLSIGVRLTLWYVAIFALAEILFGAGMWFILRANLFDIVDDGVESQIEDVKTFLATQKKEVTLAKLQEEFGATYGIEHSGDFLALYTEGGDAVYLSAFLRAHPTLLLPPDRIGDRIYRRRKAEGHLFRFIFQKLNV